MVEGQQRLTTICILLQCIADRLKTDGETSAAQDVDRLLQARALGEPPAGKIVLDSLDAGEFVQLLAGKTPARPDNHNLALAFSSFHKWVNDKKLADLGTFLYRLKNQCIVIRLDVSDAKDAFKLFETINNRGLKLSPTDIIKNFILGNAARFGPDALKLARAKWAELLRYLNGINIELFFRHFLCARFRQRITISFVIPNFKKVFIRQVAVAAKLSERHWYFVEEPVEDDAEEVAEAVIDNGKELPASEVEKIPSISFAGFL